MANLVKRRGISVGLVVTGQRVDTDVDEVVSEFHVNTWGGKYDRLDEEVAVMFQAALNDALSNDFDALAAKARKVAVDFGLESVGSPQTGGGKK